jgi:hypothetical protein
LHALLNLGAASLVGGFFWMQPLALRMGAGLLAAAFALLGAMVLPGLCAACMHAVDRAVDLGPERRVLHVGLACAVFAGLATAGIGVAMAARLSGSGGLPLLPWVDVHAGLGVLGWALGLVAAVGAVVVPMFQGTQAPHLRRQWLWLAALLLVVALGAICVVLEGRASLLRFGGAACLAAFASAGLWRQWRAPRARNAWLVRAWRVGLAALLSGAVAVAFTGEAVLAGVLVLGIGLPWLVAGMQMEIVAFVGWIDLHRVVGRGVRLPPVQALATDADKAAVFALHGLASALLLAAACWPGDATARAAGLALAAAHASLGWRLHGIDRRCRDFRMQPRPARGAGATHGD